MKGKRMPSWLFSLGSLIAAASFLAAQEAPDLGGSREIPNFSRSGSIAFAGQPSEKGLEEIRAAGYKAVLNLRTPEERSLEERQAVEALGLRYFNLPITGDSITDEKVAEFSRIVNDPANQPLLIHCASSNRVGGLWFIHRALDGGAEESRALEDGKKAGLRSPALEKTVRDYVRERKKD